ncbi:MAG: DUF368 domain-containing protein [Fusobacterium sp. JB021]|nr:DUF368 domain-containing protein [Fusobacterium sp. JB020]MDP0493443.1 DUF368 domain-containing protein [Fusobacterium sp. JB021]MDP0507677.1 DUF368 domain-containing protein [Fusobacterium sp. JB019]
MKINNFIINMFKGMGIGIANVIPGVSGGTMAIVFGIYDKLIEALANFITASIKKKVEYIIFIAPIIIGAVVGILGFARIVEFLYANYPLYTKLIFVVLVLPSIPIVVKGERIKEIKNIIYFCLGMVFVLTFFMLVHKFSAEDMSFQIRKTFDTSYGIKLLFCGSLAGGAMIIPGISGSLLLLALGEHQNVIYYISNLDFLPLGYFGVGVILGIALFTKVINYFLKRYRSLTLFFILGIVVASLIEMLINI